MTKTATETGYFCVCVFIVLNCIARNYSFNTTLSCGYHKYLKLRAVLKKIKSLMNDLKKKKDFLSLSRADTAS